MDQRHRTTVLVGWSVMLAVAAATLVLGGCAPPGMKLLRMDVYQHGKLVLRTTFDAPDSEGPDELWDHTGSEPFGIEKIVPVNAQVDDPLRAKLTGPVQIKILHVDRVLTSASLTDLELVRRTPKSQSWYLPSVEVTRARQAAGF